MDNPFQLLLQELKEIKSRLDSMPQATSEKKEVELIDRAELCKRLGITIPTVRKWEAKKRIPVIRLGSSIRYNWFKVIEKLESK